MLDADLENLLEGKDEAARSHIATRAGQQLSIGGLSEVEQLATEALARELARDAVERVRCELSKAIRHAKFLPRDLALKIAHDVDSVACPFLEVTEVFSDSDWQQLVLTVSKSALVAVARRSSMTEKLALTLSESGSSAVVETLIENPAAPMTEPVCHTVMDRFAPEPRILDKMAQRDDLILEIAIKLTAKVSAAARKKLACSYKMPDYTEPVGVNAEAASILELIRGAPESRLPALVQSLKEDDKLTHLLLLTAARENLLEFLEAALSALSSVRQEQVRSILLHEGAGPFIKLLRQAHVPSTIHDDFWDAITDARSEK